MAWLEWSNVELAFWRRKYSTVVLDRSYVFRCVFGDIQWRKGQGEQMVILCVLPQPSDFAVCSFCAGIKFAYEKEKPNGYTGDVY